MKARRLVAAATLLTLSAACGTTVTTTAGPVAPLGDELGGSAGTDVSAAGPTGTVGDAAGAPTAGTGAAATRGRPVTGTPSVTATAGALERTRAVPAGGTIAIGYPTFDDSGAALSAFGISGASIGDPEAQMAVVVKALNARGGILGRRVVAVPHDFPALGASSDPEGTATAACAEWSEKKVFAVVNVSPNAAMRSCLAKAGIPLVTSLGISSAASVFGDTLPGVYAPSAMSIDRSVRAVVDRLVARKFFTGWDPATGRPGPQPVKIGMQSFDTPDGQHVVAVTRKALAAHGLTLDEVEAHGTEVSDNSSSTSSAVLRFRANGITHVFDANLVFFQTADSQGYRPRYAIQDTINTPALLAQNVGASQLHGSMGAGYLPAYEAEDAPDVSPEATRCLTLMREAGQDTAPTIARAYMLHYCDALAFLEKALTSAGTVSVRGLRDGAAALGSVPSHVTYGTRITAARRDGATRIRDFEYVDACTCFRHPSTTTYAAD